MSYTNKEYLKFLESKIKLASKNGFHVDKEDLHPILKPHQSDVVQWALEGGNRAVFLSFGLGKTIVQLELMRQCYAKTNKPCLVVCPLGVKHEFVRDGKKMGLDLSYITNTNLVTSCCNFYITNYERIRKQDIDPSIFSCVTFDEASILRGLATQTVDVLMSMFKVVPYKFVCTATPSPNRFLELINYAEFLGIADRGLTLTKFFQRDSTSAGNLTIYKKQEKAFWYWMSSWACFITKPSDLGYDNSGYDLPPIKLHYHRIDGIDRDLNIDKYSNQIALISNPTKSLIDASKEKRTSLQHRVSKMKEIIDNDPDSNFIIWHDLENERHEIQRVLGKDCKSVYGSQDLEEREDYIIGFSEGKYKYLSTKPVIAGSGCNFQYHCNKAIFLGIGYKFNDFIQAIHRIYRFMQENDVEVHLIYTDVEDDILKTLLTKWSNHSKLQSEMTNIVQQYGLTADVYKTELSRDFFESRNEKKSSSYHFINNDCVLELPRIKDDSVGLIVTSIPFGNHYEYSENYNCMGHNATNEEFFKQMDFLVPELFRVLSPGRIAAIHVKDRIRYSYMHGQTGTILEPFSDDTVASFRKHGFSFISRITVTTDVVRENNQTYRLTHGEVCKDSTKIGAGLPEYVLLFRKPPTEKQNAYADIPVTHTREEYDLATWQLDAHSFWKSKGNRLVDSEWLKMASMPNIIQLWNDLDTSLPYSFELHKQVQVMLSEIDKLPKTFFALQPQSNSSEVWNDITRMRTLNSNQTRSNLEKHICPLQIDIVERLINRLSNKGEPVLDPFGGIGTVPYVATKLNRFGIGIELNEAYYQDALKHLAIAEIQANQLTLFADNNTDNEVIDDFML